MNEHLSNDVFRWRVIHSLCAVVRLVNELRNAVESVSRATAAVTGEDPYKVDGFAVEVLTHVQALCDLLPVLDKAVPVQRVCKRAPRVSAPDVSRETFPWDEDTEVTEVDDGR